MPQQVLTVDHVSLPPAMARKVSKHHNGRKAKRDPRRLVGKGVNVGGQVAK
jgi:hypothetical protein